MVVQENFCGACFALPLAFAGAGTAAVSNDKKMGGVIFWSIVISVIGFFASLWFLSGNCKSCSRSR